MEISYADAAPWLTRDATCCVSPFAIPGVPR